MGDAVYTQTPDMDALMRIMPILEGLTELEQRLVISYLNTRYEKKV